MNTQSQFSAPRTPRELFTLLAQLEPGDRAVGALAERIDFRGVDPAQIVRGVFGRAPAPHEGQAEAEYDAKAHFVASLASPEFRARAIELFLHAFPEKRRLFFIHIPKCAGTDLRAHLFPKFLAIPHLWASEAWMPEEVFIAAVAAAARSVGSVEEILIYGHLPLAWYVNRVGRRLEDRIFTIVRDPVELVISQANYAVDVLVRDPEGKRPDSRANLQILGLPRLPENASPDQLKELALRAFLDARTTPPNLICTYLAGPGNGAAEALANIVVRDVELTDTTQYNGWLDEEWGIRSQTRRNRSTPYLSRADVEEHGEHLRMLTEEDRKVFDAVALALARAGRHSIRGTALAATASASEVGVNQPTLAAILGNAAAAHVSAAESGDADAQFRLGVMFCTGREVPRDIAAGALWYGRAAEQGHALAQHNIAVMLLNGQGVRPDAAAGFEWARKAAVQNVPEAQLLLGDLHAAGNGTTADPATARYWYEQAAAHGSAVAIAKLRDLAPRSAVAAPAPGGAARRDPPSGSARIALITMVYNESINLPIWLRHYRQVAPTAAVFVIDHGSDDGSTDDLAGVNKIPLPRGRLDEIDRTRLINSLQQGLMGFYDVVIHADCDELILPDPGKWATIEQYLGARSDAYVAPVGIHLVHIVDREPPIDFGRPLLQQRRYGHFHAWACKPAITRIPLRWGLGFHTCDQPPNIDSELFLFHIKQIDRDEALRRQGMRRQLPWSDRAIASGHSAHHRYADERFLHELFVEPANRLRQSGAQPFSFLDDIARVAAEAKRAGGLYDIPQFKGPIVEIPARFRNAF